MADTGFLVKWTPFRLAQTLRCLQQGTLNIGNDYQNRTYLLNLAVAQANLLPSGAGWAKWRVNTQSRTSGAGLLINVPAVPGYVPPFGTGVELG